MSRTAMLVTIIVLLGVGAAGYILFFLPEDSGSSRIGEDTVKELSFGEQEEAANKAYADEKDAQARARLFETWATAIWASPTAGLLRRAMLTDPSSLVRKAALDASMKIAVRDMNPWRRLDILRTAFNSGNDDLLHHALNQVREHPEPELTPDLLTLASVPNAGTVTRSNILASWALAFTDDDKAREFLIAAASNESMDKDFRVQNIALLAKVKTPEAKALLERLAGSPDEGFASVAREALKEHR